LTSIGSTGFPAAVASAIQLSNCWQLSICNTGVCAGIAGKGPACAEESSPNTAFHSATSFVTAAIAIVKSIHTTYPNCQPNC
jgi:hypothetical protein